MRHVTVMLIGLLFLGAACSPPEASRPQVVSTTTTHESLRGGVDLPQPAQSLTELVEVQSPTTTEASVVEVVVGPAARIIIPCIGLDAEIYTENPLVDDNGNFASEQVVNPEYGRVAHWGGSQQPGIAAGSGDSFLLAHINDLFAQLDQLEPGCEITVSDSLLDNQGNIFRFVVEVSTLSGQHDKSELPIAEMQDQNPVEEPTLWLITCECSRVLSNGHCAYNTVVKASLVSFDPAG